jgi:hypothetical protein
MSFCSAGDIATVTYNFGYGEKIYKTTNSPINIEAADIRTKITYGLAWFKPSNHPDQFDIVEGTVTIVSGCANDNLDNSYLVLSNGFIPFFQGKNACSISFESLPALIKITDSQNIIYQETGNRKPSYRVGCGDNCPEGFCKCEISEYPGYCCLNCTETAQKINNIANKIR